MVIESLDFLDRNFRKQEMGNSNNKIDVSMDLILKEINKLSDLLQVSNRDNAYYDKVKFYETYIKENDNLLYEEKLDLTLDYVLSIFSIGKYHKFLSLVDPIIETIIRDNILSFNDQDLFQILLLFSTFV